MYIYVVQDKVIWTVNCLRYLNRNKTNIQYQGHRKKLQVPTSRIKQNKSRKETASARNKIRTETARRPRESKTNEKIE